MEIKAPTFPESIADGSVAQWHHQPGAFVARDDLLVDIETDKVVIEVYAPEDGVLEAIVSLKAKRYFQKRSSPIFSQVNRGQVPLGQNPLRRQRIQRPGTNLRVRQLRKWRWSRILKSVQLRVLAEMAE